MWISVISQETLTQVQTGRFSANRADRTPYL